MEDHPRIRRCLALELETRTTVIVAPRQTGKSYSLTLLGLWQAFRKREQRVLIVSASEDAAKRVLAEMIRVAQSPLLVGSIVNETAALLLLSNGSEIRSVPASERAIRGWSVDLLIVDEAALVNDDVLLSAAIPTTAARPDARIVLASTPWATQGAFYRNYVAGLGGSDGVKTFQWSLGQAPWISEQVIEHARRTLSPLRFAAEFEAKFVGAGDAFFPPDDLLACSSRRTHAENRSWSASIGDAASTRRR